MFLYCIGREFIRGLVFSSNVGVLSSLVFLGDAQFSEDVVQKVADHYSARTNQTLEEREASPIIHLKKLNNWVC